MARESAVSALPREVQDQLNRQLIDQNFTGYEDFETWLRNLGYEISKSSIHRYGQKIERRMAAIRASTEAAKFITEAAGDDQDARSEAVIALVQSEMFDSIIAIQEAGDEDDEKLSAAERIGLMSAAAKNIATLTRASIAQKEFKTKVLAKVSEDAFKAAISGATAEGLTPEQAARVGEAVARRIQIYLPDNGR
ncbi:DUF3486 family protein [Quatrionicoccus australiensis]|uniref:DUF3486 family protein n=1 Tax=Quatrionicoccus australiensis TaxID=138118 RepID=UPI001CF813D8|nr:DUF3486 family protein [Quatrionicoccus australiensis]UCV13803.1 DUF3486 family protein [Quatrionicoccus australiensis]